MKFFQKRSVAIVLCLLMILSALWIGHQETQSQELVQTIGHTGLIADAVGTGFRTIIGVVVFSVVFLILIAAFVVRRIILFGKTIWNGWKQRSK